MTVPYAKYDPLRKPTWRYDTIIKLIDKGSSRVRRASYDAYIFTALKFIRRFRKTSKSERIGLFIGNEGLYYACELFENREDNDTRVGIEARLLAGQDDEQIAQQYATLPSTIEWYEALFFNVRDRLHCRDWLNRVVEGPTSSRMPAERGEEIAIKHVAMNHGQLALEEVLGNSQLQVMITDESKLETFWEDLISRNMARRLAVQSFTAQINEYTFAPYWSNITADRATRHQIKSDSASAGAVETVVAGMLSSITFDYGVDAKNQIELQKRAIGNSAVELRAEDALRFSKGELKDLSELKNLRITKIGATENGEEASN